VSGDPEARPLFEARRRIDQERYGDACHLAGLALESLLRRLYAEAEVELSPEARSAVVAALRGHVGKTPSSAWTLGVLTRAFTDHHRHLLPALAGRYDGAADLPLHLLNCLDFVRDQRNDAVHSNRGSATRVDATICVGLVETLLRVFRAVGDYGRVSSGLDAASDELLLPAIRRIPTSASSASLEVLGLTLDRAVSLLRIKLIPELQAQCPGAEIVVRALMLDPRWEELGRIDALWPKLARSGEDALREQAPVFAQRFPGVRIVAHAYRQVPTIHGFRLNGERVVASILRFEGTRVIGSSAPYFSADGSESECHAMLVGHFEQAWRAANANTSLVASSFLCLAL
jgi:hypothetical protein